MKEIEKKGIVVTAKDLTENVEQKISSYRQWVATKTGAKISRAKALVMLAENSNIVA